MAPDGKIGGIEQPRRMASGARSGRGRARAAGQRHRSATPAATGRGRPQGDGAQPRPATPADAGAPGRTRCRRTAATGRAAAADRAVRRSRRLDGAFRPPRPRGAARADPQLPKRRRGEIGRFAGHLAKFLGDGALAYFGWPTAHENDAERAVRAALAILRAVGRIRTPDGEPLAARAGIATGTVVVESGSGLGRRRRERHRRRDAQSGRPPADAGAAPAS